MLHVEPMSKCTIQNTKIITQRGAPLKLDYLGTKGLGLFLFFRFLQKGMPSIQY